MQLKGEIAAIADLAAVSGPTVHKEFPRHSEDGMILWAIVICAAVGFALGAHCRLILLIAASAVVAACLPILIHATESTPLSSALSILGMLATLQVFFLAGAAIRVSGPGVPSDGWRTWYAARFRAPAAREATGTARRFMN